MASFRGKKCCSCLAKWLPAYEAELLRRGLIRVSLDVYQLTGRAKASAPAGASSHSSCSEAWSSVRSRSAERYSSSVDSLMPSCAAAAKSANHSG